jgi:hypothetical protein
MTIPRPIITSLCLTIGLLLWAGVLQAAPAAPAKSLGDLAGEATIICTCQVVDQQSQWDTEQSALVTLVTLHVEEYLKGAGGQELAVETLGGIVGDKGLKVTGAPVFEQGERAVLFLKPAGETAPANTKYDVVGEAQGKFTIRTDPTSGEDHVEWNWRGIRHPELPELRTLDQLKAALRAVSSGDMDDQLARGTEKSYVPGELLVKFKAGVTESRIAEITQQQRTKIIGRIGAISVYRVKILSGRSVEEAVRTYSQLPEIEYAEPNSLARALPEDASTLHRVK